ncbi:transglycosylase SLT domain-containing protein [Hyalangium rubrum]|uniref:Transglycosylase SLT domain-containing protein n=1 Tax=Hyalangium rubrum TaxID=3103134 RepID=A0ABU5H998_9BACT|nr:transglycosylase SLT domain-containing protein [Hyalangium sp. s54d21]MDY7229347.1 transglycosylase SLT domain-containing protein [Hyalangium sp. s54d21]
MDVHTQERSIEDLRIALQGRRSPAAQQLRLAIEATPRQPAETLRLAVLLQQDPLFAPYGLQLEAANSRTSAREFILLGKHAEALEAAQKALTLFQRASDNCPSPLAVRKLPEELGRTQSVAGEAYHGQQQWAEAQRTYESAFAHFAASGLLKSFLPETLGRYAEACARQVPPSKTRGVALSPSCLEWLRRFVQLEGQSSPKAQAIAKHVALKALGDLRPPASARTPAPSAALDTQAFAQAMDLYRARKFEQASSAFQALPETYPTSPHVLRSRYWRGRSLAQSKKPKEAKQVFQALVEDAPLTYYGLLAALASGEDLQARIASLTPKASTRDPVLTQCEFTRVERAEHFLSEGMGTSAAEELQGLATREVARFGSSFLLYLAMLHSEAGDDPVTFLAVSELLRRKHPSALTPFTLRLLFPPRHLELVQKYATEHQLEPALVLSVMKQESSFRPTAVSDQGAVGLMQLLPSTAEEMEKGIGKQLSQVEPNIRVGTKYLRKLLNHFCGNRALALAGYNAGMRKVANWRKQGLVQDELIDFIEALPVRETRDYVSQIIRNHYWYSSRVIDTKPLPMEHFWSSGASAKTQKGRCPP